MNKLIFRSMKANLFLTSILMLCFGCATQPQKYYFGDYSRTLYTYEKNKNDETLLKHKQELQKIISESEKRKLTIPPGIYAELGYLDLKSNDINNAVMYFNKEAELYPESKLFIDRLINKATSKNNANTNTSVVSKDNDLQSN